MHGIGRVERNDVHAEEREAGDRACGMANSWWDKWGVKRREAGIESNAPCS